jgi:uncharacterized protein (DUF1800 family)
MFTSRAFYSDRAIGTQVKSPIQLVIGTLRLLGGPMPPVRQLTGALDQMGQIPLAPPNVKGWPGGRAWINTSTLFVRYNTCVMLAGQGDAVETVGVTGPADEVVDYWVGRLIQRPIAADKRKTLLETISRRAGDESAVRSMTQLIVSMPEYQLC